MCVCMEVMPQWVVCVQPFFDDLDPFLLFSMLEAYSVKSIQVEIKFRALNQGRNIRIHYEELARLRECSLFLLNASLYGGIFFFYR